MISIGINVPFVLMMMLIQSIPPGLALATTMSTSGDIAVIGCGVLGTSLCRQILASADFDGRSGEFVPASF